MQSQPRTSTTPSAHMIDMRKRGGAWREEIWDRIGRMRDTLVRASAAALPAQTGVQVDEHLERAQSIANDSYWRWMARKGSRIEAAWRELRLAEETYLADAPDSEVLVLAWEAAQHGARHLESSDPLVTELNDLIKNEPTAYDKLREHAVVVLRGAHESSDADHRKLRAVGEQIAATAAGLAILAVLVVLVIARLDWQFLPPVARAEGTNIEGWQLVALAMVSGLIGAMFSAIPSVSLIPDKRQPFNPVWRQATLKMVIGAWSGFVGLVAVTAGLVEPLVQAAQDGTSGGVALSGFVMTAALFGAGQEAVTRFADRKATIARDTTLAGAG